jgi:hypothetical protein
MFHILAVIDCIVKLAGRYDVIICQMQQHANVA